MNFVFRYTRNNPHFSRKKGRKKEDKNPLINVVKTSFLRIRKISTKEGFRIFTRNVKFLILLSGFDGQK